MVKNPLSNSGDASLIPGKGTTIPHVAGQLSSFTATRKSLHATMKSPRAAKDKAAAAAKSLQLCSTLCDSIDGSPPGSSIPGILQARTLEWQHSYR